MSEPFLGQLCLFSFTVIPKGWAPCQGQLLQISQNQALFALLGTTFGGDGRTTFGLPDLRGRTGVSSSPTFNLGQMGGEELHTLNQTEVPGHTHSLQATTTSTNPVKIPAGHLLSAARPMYVQAAPNTNMANTFVGTAGGSQGHENRTPFLVMSWCIALVGIFPSRN
jgi:microcystin-dependent protein